MSDTNVTVENGVIVVEMVAAQGLPGIKGDKGDKGDTGDPGGAAAAYIHTQSVPSALWLINHNLGYNPHVSIINHLGAVIDAEIIHTSVNQTQIITNPAVMGEARCL